MSENRNVQSGQPPAESTTEAPQAAERAGRSEGTHYEPDPDQIVKVVHQVKPDELPVEGPTDFETRGPTDDTRYSDVRVTPTQDPVREGRSDAD